MFTRKEYATAVSGKTANGCPVRSAEPPDNMDFHFISPWGRNATRFYMPPESKIASGGVFYCRLPRKKKVTAK